MLNVDGYATRWRSVGGRNLRAGGTVGRVVAAALALGLGVPVWAQAQAQAPRLNDHVKADIERHLAIAAAHEAAARCLAAGRPEADCVKALQASCKGLAIGKYCGMKHGH